MLAQWNESGLIDQLKEIKHVYSEDRQVRTFDKVFQQFVQSLDNYGKFCSPNRMMSNGIEEAKRQGVTTGSITGAIFFGVSRGKISEGIDFKDYMARAVISVSIPFSNPQYVCVSFSLSLSLSLIIIL